jgi:hypothetical protein
MPRYGEAAQKSVERVMRERKQGKLKSGKSNKRVTDRKQAIAIGLAEARRKGAKVPAKATGSSRGTSRRSKSGAASSRSTSRSSRSSSR